VGDLPWHPLLVGLAVVLAFWIDQPVSPYAGLRLIPGALIAMAAITGLLWLMLRNRHRAGLIATGLIVLVWSKHVLVVILDGVTRLGPLLATLWLVAIGLAIVLVVRLAARHLRRAWSSPELSRRLNVGGGVLVLATILSGVVYERTAAIGIDLTNQDAAPPPIASADDASPDIYVFLLDMYARADVLAERYDYDNEPFLDALSQRGFAVSPESRSAYPYTHLALPALLHMDYIEAIDPMAAVFAGEAPVRPTIRLAINQNPVFDLLRERGYIIQSVSSGFEDYTIRHAEEFWDGGQLNEFELQFLESTFVGDLLMAVSPDLASGQLRDRIRSTLRRAPQIAREPSAAPRLVFVHVPAAHTPIVLGPSGEPVVARLDSDFFQDRHVKVGEDPEAFRRLYRGEVAYLNGLVLDAVDGVLDSSAEPPVIVVMSDHGPSSGIDWDGTPRDELPSAALRERIANLFAAYTPGRTSVFPPDVALVNVFRHLLDAYHGTSLGLAPRPTDGVQYDLP
jgi:hypothetical protein